ncbi:MAG: hypothetical protein AAF957_00530 [Planctomycetota bacterium]
MTEESHLENGSGSDRSLEDRIIAADVDRRAAIEESLAAGPAATETERAFLQSLRSEWIVDAGGDEAPASEVVLVPAGGADGPLRGPRGLVAAARRWEPYAAAAAVLAIAWFGGVFDGTAVDPADPEVRGPSEVYLGTEGEGVDGLPFEGRVDWGEEFGGPFFFRLVVLDTDPAEGANPVVYENASIDQTSWKCPQELLDRLPDRFRVEIYSASAAAGSAPGWQRTFRRDK